MSARGYEALGGAEKKAGPPKPNRVLGCLTSGWARLFVLAWAAYMLSVVAMTWYSVTSYHFNPSVGDQEGVWGQIYDATRSASQGGLAVAGASQDMLAGKDAKFELKTYDIVEDDFVQPKGWQAVLIHTWMVIITGFETFLALVAWFVLFHNFLITACCMTGLEVDEEVREHRQDMATDVALLVQLVVPFMCWVIQKVTGYQNCGIEQHLYRKMLAVGPLVLIGLKLLVLLMTTLKEAQQGMNRSGDIAWMLSSKDVPNKTQEVRRCALDIFDKSFVMRKGPMWLQRSCQAGMMVGHFESRPYGIVLGILGLIDELILTRLTASILRVIPSWIDDDINKAEARLAEIGEDAVKLKKELDGHLKKIKHVVEKARLILVTVQAHLMHARAITAKERALLGDSLTLQMENTIDKVDKPLQALQKDVDFTLSEITKVEDAIEKEANKALAAVLEKIKALTKLMDCFRPENIMTRLDDLADGVLYGELIRVMAQSAAAGAAPLELAVQLPAQP